MYSDIEGALAGGRIEEAHRLLEGVFATQYKLAGAPGSIPPEWVLWHFHRVEPRLLVLRARVLLPGAHRCCARGNVADQTVYFKTLSNTPINQDNPEEAQLAQAIWALNPFPNAGQTIREASHLAKERPDGAFDLIRPLLENAMVPLADRQSAGWIVYYKLRTFPKDFLNILQLYLYNLAPHQASRPHSLILGITLKAYKNNERLRSSFPTLLYQYGLENFRPEDYEEDKIPTKDGANRVIGPLIDQAAKLAIDALMQTRAPQPEWLTPFVKKLLERPRPYVWLIYSYVKLLIAQGQHDTAKALLERLRLSKGSEFWYWDCYAALYPEDPEMQVGLLLIALEKGGEPKYLVGVRERLWHLLEQQGHPEAAAEQLYLLVQDRKQANWPISKRLHDAYEPLAENPPRRGATKAIATPYLNWAKKAIFGEDSFKVYTLIGKRLSKKGDTLLRFISMDGHEKFEAKEKAHKLFRRLKSLGASLRISVAWEERQGEDGKPRRVAKVQDAELDGTLRAWAALEEGEGVVKDVDEKGNVYLQQIEPGDRRGCFFSRNIPKGMVLEVGNRARVFYFLSKDKKGNRVASIVHAERLE